MTVTVAARRILSDLASARPRRESLYDTEALASRYVYDGNEVELVLALGPRWEWALVRRKHDRKRLVVDKSDLKPIVPPVTIDFFRGFTGSRGFNGFPSGFPPLRAYAESSNVTVTVP